MLGRLEALLGSDPPAEEVSKAFWHACTAGQRRVAEYLLSRGADLNWEPDYAHGTPLDAASGPSTRQENVVFWLRSWEPVLPAPIDSNRPRVPGGSAGVPRRVGRRACQRAGVEVSELGDALGELPAVRGALVAVVVHEVVQVCAAVAP